MKMRSGGTTGAAAEPDHMQLRDKLAFVDEDLRQMHVQRKQSLSVVDDDEASFVKHLASEHDRAGVHCRDRSAFIGLEIRPIMLVLDFAVESTLRAVRIGYHAVNGSNERPGPPAMGRRAVEDLRLQLFFFIDPNLHFFIGLRKLTRDAQANVAIFCMTNCDRVMGGEPIAIEKRGFERQVRPSRSSFDRDAAETVPRTGGGVKIKEDLASEELAGELLQDLTGFRLKKNRRAIDRNRWG